MYEAKHFANTDDFTYVTVVNAKSGTGYTVTIKNADPGKAWSVEQHRIIRSCRQYVWVHKNRQASMFNAIEAAAIAAVNQGENT